MSYKNKTTQSLTAELNKVENRIARIIANVNGFVDKALADHREAIKEQLERRAN